MRKFRVGVWLNNVYKPVTGGGYGYNSTLVDAISQTSFKNADICFLSNVEMNSNQIGLYPIHVLGQTEIRKQVRINRLKLHAGLFFKLKSIERYFHKLNKSLYDDLYKICDIIYYLTPGCEFPNYPFIYTLWDLGHLSTYAFPEVNNDGIFESRKTHHDFIPHKALMVLCESESGKNEAIQYLHLNKDRIKVLPLFPSEIISKNIVPFKPKLINEEWTYIHYPAQYWAHKNHFNLILAFQNILYKYPNLKLILTGSDQGNKSYIANVIREYNLGKSIIELGFVSPEELKWLYIHSKGLILPTFLGPTNMPPLEALTLGCPVAVSDLPGHHEQLGDNAIYFDPLNIKSIGNAIELILTRKIDILNIEIPSAKINMKLLDNYFEEIRSIRFTWE